MSLEFDEDDPNNWVEEESPRPIVTTQSRRKRKTKDEGSATRVNPAGKFTCTECANIFRYTFTLRRHQKNFHKDIYKCILCDKKITDSETVEDHMFSCHNIGPDYAWRYRKWWFGKENEHQSHISSMIETGQPGDAVATVKTDVNPESLLRPSNSQPTSDSPQSTRTGQNSAEIRLADIQKPMVEEIMTEEEYIDMPSLAPEAALKSPDLTGLQRQDKYQCMMCHQKLSDPDSIKNHMVRYHCIPDIYSCACCSWWFTSIVTRGKHISSLIDTGHPGHGAVAKSDVEPGSLCLPESQLSKKAITNRRYNKKKSLEIVAVDDAVPKPMVRFVTTKAFDNMPCVPKAALKSYEEKFECRTCTQKFCRISSFYRHRKLFHKDENEKSAHSAPIKLPAREHQCPVCSKTFFWASELRSHRHEFHKADLQCMVCDQNISGKETVKEHMISCHNINRVYVCRCCNWWFGDANEYRNHVGSIIATGQPGSAIAIAKGKVEPGSLLRTTDHPPTLEQCETPSSALLSTGCGKHTSDEICLAGIPNLQAEEITTAKGTYECPQCNKTFITGLALGDHLRRSHENQHMCLVCDQKVPNYVSVGEHMIKYHNIPKIYSCACCNWSFRDEDEKHKHIISMIDTGQPGDACAIAKSDVVPGSICPPESQLSRGALPSRYMKKTTHELVPNGTAQKPPMEETTMDKGFINPPGGELPNHPAKESYRVVCAYSNDIQEIEPIMEEISPAVESINKPAETPEPALISNPVVQKSMLVETSTYRGKHECMQCHKKFSHGFDLSACRLRKSIKEHMKLHGFARIFWCGCCNWAFATVFQQRKHIDSMIKTGEPGNAFALSKTDIQPGSHGPPDVQFSTGAWSTQSTKDKALVRMEESLTEKVGPVCSEPINMSPQDLEDDLRDRSAVERHKISLSIAKSKLKSNHLTIPDRVDAAKKMDETTTVKGSLCPPESQPSKVALRNPPLWNEMYREILTLRNATEKPIVEETSTAEEASIIIPFQAPDPKSPDMPGLMKDSNLDHQRRDQHQCMLCDQKLSDPETTNEHMRQCHGIPTIFFCACCNWLFPNIIEQQKHIRSMIDTRQPGDAIVIAKSDVEPGSLCVPEIQHSKDAFKGSLHRRNMKSLKRRDLDDAAQNNVVEETTTAEEKFECWQCPRKYTTPISLSYHRMERHKNQHVCLVCDQTVSVSESIKEHMKCHGFKRIYLCGCCNWSFPDITEQRKHIDSMVETGEPGTALVIAKTDVKPGSLGPPDVQFSTGYWSTRKCKQKPARPAVAAQKLKIEKASTLNESISMLPQDTELDLNSELKVKQQRLVSSMIDTGQPGKGIAIPKRDIDPGFISSPTSLPSCVVVLNQKKEKKFLASLVPDDAVQKQMMQETATDEGFIDPPEAQFPNRPARKKYRIVSASPDDIQEIEHNVEEISPAIESINTPAETPEMDVKPHPMIEETTTDKGKHECPQCQKTFFTGFCLADHRLRRHKEQHMCLVCDQKVSASESIKEHMMNCFDIPKIYPSVHYISSFGNRAEPQRNISRMIDTGHQENGFAIAKSDVELEPSIVPPQDLEADLNPELQSEHENHNDLFDLTEHRVTRRAVRVERHKKISLSSAKSKLKSKHLTIPDRADAAKKPIMDETTTVIGSVGPPETQLSTDVLRRSCRKRKNKSLEIFDPNDDVQETTKVKHVQQGALGPPGVQLRSRRAKKKSPELVDKPDIHEIEKLDEISPVEESINKPAHVPEADLKSPELPGPDVQFSTSPCSTPHKRYNEARKKKLPAILARRAAVQKPMMGETSTTKGSLGTPDVQFLQHPTEKTSSEFISDPDDIEIERTMEKVAPVEESINKPSQTSEADLKSPEMQEQFPTYSCSSPYKRSREARKKHLPAILARRTAIKKPMITETSTAKEFISKPAENPEAGLKTHDDAHNPVVDETTTAKGKYECLQCDQKFYTGFGLTEHRVRRHKKHYVCMVCNQKISVSESLKAHMWRDHAINKICSCDCCNWWFRDQDEQLKHIISMINTGQPGNAVAIAKSGVEPGSICSPESQMSPALLRHCKKKKSAEIPGVAVHKLIMEETKGKGPLDPAGVQPRSRRVEQKSRQVSDDSDEDIQKILRIIREMKSADEASYKPAEVAIGDLKSRKSKQECMQCHKKFADGFILGAHRLREHLNHHTCLVCNQKLSDAESIKEHMKRHGFIRIFLCGCCNWSFANVMEQRKHVRSMIETGEPGNACVLSKTDIPPGSLGPPDAQFSSGYWSTKSTQLLVSAEEASTEKEPIVVPPQDPDADLNPELQGEHEHDNDLFDLTEHPVLRGFPRGLRLRKNQQPGNAVAIAKSDVQPGSLGPPYAQFPRSTWWRTKGKRKAKYLVAEETSANTNMHQMIVESLSSYSNTGDAPFAKIPLEFWDGFFKLYPDIEQIMMDIIERDDASKSQTRPNSVALQKESHLNDDMNFDLVSQVFSLFGTVTENSSNIGVEKEIETTGEASDSTSSVPATMECIPSDVQTEANRLQLKRKSSFFIDDLLFK